MKITSFLIVTVLASLSLAATAPHSPEADTRFKAIENLAYGSIMVGNHSGKSADKAPSSDGLDAVRLARATYDVAVASGAVGAHPLGVSLPAKAIIKQAWLNIKTQFTDNGAGTVAFHCEDANNIITAQDITGLAAGTNHPGAASGPAGSMVGSIAAECEITATVATTEQTAGKGIVFVEYVVGE